MIPQAPGKSMRAGLEISGQRAMELQARLRDAQERFARKGWSA